MANFFDSNTFIALASGGSTLLAGSAAYIVYRSQKAREKKDTANVLYQEIIYAETVIKEIKFIKAKTNNFTDAETQNLLDPNKLLMRNSTWDTNKYLFVNDFDSNQWNLLNIFFDQCSACDNALMEIKKLIPTNIEDRIAAVQQGLSFLALDYSKDCVEYTINNPQQSEIDPNAYSSGIAKIGNKYKALNSAYISKYIGDLDYQFLYTAEKDYNLLAKTIDNTNDSISISSMGTKLKKIAKLK